MKTIDFDTNKDDFIPYEKLVPLYTKRKSKKKNIKYILVVAFVLACLLIEYVPNLFNLNDASKIVSVNQNVIEEAGNFYAHFIDVGQADCELLKCGDDVVLIDAGDIDGFKTIESYLDALNVTEIDYFIITHMHADHMGSAAKVIEKYKPKNIIMTKLTKDNMPTTDLYGNLLNTLSKCDSKIIAANPGATYELESFSFTVLAPNANYEDLNNTSVVVRAEYGKNSFVFQGDAEAKSEKDILSKGFNVKADVIKLGHHGSKTSSSEAYLMAVNPQIAIACCGVNNRYNHPSQETLNKLDKFNISYFRTDMRGNIVVKSDGSTLSVITER